MREPDKAMPRIFVHASSPVLRNALGDLLGLWPDVERSEDPECANVIFWEGDGLPPVEDRATWPSLLRLHPQAEDPALRPPIRWREVVPRLVSVLESAVHANTGDTRPFPVGPYQCIPLERTLYDEEGADRARLTEKELALLLRLDAAGDAGASRAALLQDVWGYAEGLDTHTLETHIYRLRQKIEVNPENPAYLVTREGGYALLKAHSCPPDREGA